MYVRAVVKGGYCRRSPQALMFPQPGAFTGALPRSWGARSVRCQLNSTQLHVAHLWGKISFYRAEVNKYRSFGSSSAKVVYDSTRLEGKAGFRSKSENLGRWKFCLHVGVLRQCSFACITKVKRLFFCISNNYIHQLLNSHSKYGFSFFWNAKSYILLCLFSLQGPKPVAMSNIFTPMS